MINVLFSDRDENWAAWEAPLRTAFESANVKVDLHRSYETPEQVDYVVYSPASPLQDFQPYTNLKAVLSMWAGVESIEGNQTLNVPLARMVDPGLTEGMLEYVTGHILRYHLGMDQHIHNTDAWQPETSPPLARSRNIGFLGLGALGLACAEAAQRLNFNVEGWSRNAKTLDNLTTHHGNDGLKTLLNRSEILVLLLPLTDETRDLMNAETLNMLPKGACIINPGRGPLIVDEDLVDALNKGHLAHATLDVFRKEPLTQDHPFWTHPKVTITPHIAAETRPETAAHVIAENIQRSQAGRPLLNLVDRSAGY